MNTVWQTLGLVRQCLFNKVTADLYWIINVIDSVPTLCTYPTQWSVRWYCWGLVYIDRKWSGRHKYSRDSVNYGGEVHVYIRTPTPIVD